MGRKPASRVEVVLDELRAYGFIISSRAEAALLADPPKTEAAFVNAVLAIEGLGSPDVRTRHESDLVAYVRSLVRDWLFDEGQGKGTRSGLPFTCIEGSGVG